MATKCMLIAPVRAGLGASSRRTAVVISHRYYITRTEPRKSTATLEPAPLSITRPSPKSPAPSPSAALAILPLPAVLRTYMITTLSSSPQLLSVFIYILSKIANSQSLLFSPERNRLLHWILKRTFYNQFCTGENGKEVQRTIANLKSTGYTGVMLEFALEVLGSKGTVTAEQTAREIEIWRQGLLESVRLVEDGDFVGLKWSGLGSEALGLLDHDKRPTDAMYAAMVEVCDLAAAKNVSLIPSAELARTNVGIDNWTIDLQRKYNRRKDGNPILYTTYQCYLRSAPQRLARDLAIAEQEGFTLGVKLVRGAYLATEVKTELCQSKEETDAQYDAMVSSVLNKTYNNVVKPASNNSTFPGVSLVIACHNMPSVKKALAIRARQSADGTPLVPCAFAQLQGMADDISCELVKTAKKGPFADAAEPRTFKFTSWGTMTECLQFLLRRAAENQDAASRTADTRRAMGKEIWRRWKATFGSV